MDVVAVIPARSGSKGLKHKNIKPFAGSSLLACAVQFCLKSSVDKLVVTSDSKKYLDLTEESMVTLGLSKKVTLHHRSKEASEDSAKDIDVFRELYSQGILTINDAIAWVRPTSPLRDLGEFNEAKHLFVSQYRGAGTLRSLKPARTHPYWMKVIVDQSLNVSGFIEGCDEKTYPNRQKLPRCMEITSEFDFMSVRDIVGQGLFFPSKMHGYITSKYPKVDIDSFQDFIAAEAIFMAMFEGKFDGNNC